MSEVAAAPPIEKEGDVSTPKEKKKPKVFIGNYEIVKNLGEGSFAKVKLGVHKLTRQNVSQIM